MLWAGFGVAAMIATPALLMPEGFTRLLQPLRVLHPEWVGRAARAADRGALAVQGDRRRRSRRCFAGAVVVQALLVAFYLAIAHSMQHPDRVRRARRRSCPISFIVQMLPVSMNGFGVREATFGFYFTRLGLPLESALLVSFIGAALFCCSRCRAAWPTLPATGIR